MLELTLKNLTESQVVDILSELVSLEDLSEITKVKLRDRKIEDKKIIMLLIKALPNNVEKCSYTIQ